MLFNKEQKSRQREKEGIQRTVALAALVDHQHQYEPVTNHRLVDAQPLKETTYCVCWWLAGPRTKPAGTPQLMQYTSYRGIKFSLNNSLNITN